MGYMGVSKGSRKQMGESTGGCMDVCKCARKQMKEFTDGCMGVSKGKAVRFRLSPFTRATVPSFYVHRNQ